MGETGKNILIGLSIAAVIGIGVGTGIYFYRKNNKVGGSIANTNKTSTIKSMLFIGDSNTAAPFSYADQISKLYPNIRIKKIAVSGEKTDWMLSQLKDELAKNKYDVIGILGGSNDIYALDKIDSAENNLTAIYNLAHSYGSKILAVSPPNHNWYDKRTDHKQQILVELVNWVMNNPIPDYKVNFWNITNDKKYFSEVDGFLHAQAPAHKILADKTAQTLNLKS